MHKGSCLCGSVKFAISSPLGTSDGCHCTQCRKWTGHFLASVDIPRDALKIQGEENLTWHHSSEKARRGFCAKCGSSLFFDPLDTNKHKTTSVALGAFDTQPGINLDRHIFVSEKGDYYEINDGVPQNELQFDNQTIEPKK